MYMSTCVESFVYCGVVRLRVGLSCRVFRVACMCVMREYVNMCMLCRMSAVLTETRQSTHRTSRGVECVCVCVCVCVVD